MATDPGTLYIVATPIGNLEDLSPRAQRILSAVDLILAEDTRHSARLLNAFDIRTRTLAFHENNEERMTGRIISRLAAGSSVALIADAGTPLISDPGFKLVRQAHAQNIPVSPVPGPAALIAALSAAGVAPGKFLFEGFAPARAEARRKRMSALAGAAHTLVFYETPHRIKAFLADAATIFGAGREACIARELTKKFETIRQGTLGGLIEWMEQDPDQGRGEFVVIIAGAGEEHTDIAELTALLKVLLKSLSLKQAVQITAELTGAGRNEIYDLAVTLQDKVSLRDE
ncbi:MAG: 16S rRNA (cytidine(1402)-2'-O)-methyltransferase [Gammaproteobacteria bacterium]|nr:16S rRNA (cytidine(1402)-2'-O)-methyltransferase [Gammaproteobacteria bacterium]